MSKIKNRQVKDNGEFDESNWTKSHEIQSNHVVGFLNNSAQIVHWAYCIADNVFICKWGRNGGLGVASLEMQSKFYQHQAALYFY